MNAYVSLVVAPTAVQFSCVTETVDNSALLLVQAFPNLFVDSTIAQAKPAHTDIGILVKITCEIQEKVSVVICSLILSSRSISPGRLTVSLFCMLLCWATEMTEGDSTKRGQLAELCLSL